MSPRVLVPSLAVLALLAGSAPAAFAVSTQTEIVCGDPTDDLPEVDENGILVEPDASSEEDRAADYDDSAENEEIDEEVVDLTAEELAALAACLDGAGRDAAAEAADAFDEAFNVSKTFLLGTFGPDQLPYGGQVDFSLTTGSSATTARAAKAGRKVTLGKSKLKLRSGAKKALKFRLNGKGRKLLLRKGRVVAVGKLKLTDALTKKSKTTTVKIVLKLKK